jgi:hypothetical protein
MKKTSLILIVSLFAPIATLATLPQVPAYATSCGINKSPIGVSFPKNPDSYNDFTFTQAKVFCINNSTINGTSSTANPTRYKKARYALKILTNPTPTIGIPGLFRPFNYNATNTCTATQNALNIKFSLTPVSNNPNTVTVKFCRGLTSGGIGDDARMSQSVKQTLANNGYFISITNSSTVTVRRANGSVL